jgi:ArsR family transcriptional regulator
MIQMQHEHMDGMEDVIKVMRLLADPTRLRVLNMLRQSELNVSAMCDQLDLAQPTVSHHLGLLRSMGLVNTRRDGKQVFYSLNRDTVQAGESGLHVAAGEMKLHLVRGN